MTDRLRVVEIFNSIQGEGVQIGIPTTFIRLQGCNLSCEWCDTKYSWEWNKKTFPLREISEIIEECHKHHNKWICITGGEPLTQDIYPLVADLKSEEYDYKVTVETNGTIQPTTELDSLIDLWTASPKIGHYNPGVLNNMTNLQLKFVIIEGMDLDAAKQLVTYTQPDHVVFQPCAIVPFNIDRYRKNLKWVAGIIMKRGWEFRLIPQMHKLIWGDERSR